MGIKIKDFREHHPPDPHDGIHLFAFHCPGCKYDHAFQVNVSGVKSELPEWTWNGSFDKPTFHPSILCNKDLPHNRCHSFVKDGKIQFLNDCFHELKGQTVEIPDWE